MNKIKLRTSQLRDEIKIHALTITMILSGKSEEDRKIELVEEVVQEINESKRELEELIEKYPEHII